MNKQIGDIVFAQKLSENRERAESAGGITGCLLSRRPYLTDLSDGEFAHLEPYLLPPTRRVGPAR